MTNRLRFDERLAKDDIVIVFLLRSPSSVIDADRSDLLDDGGDGQSCAFSPGRMSHRSQDDLRLPRTMYVSYEYLRT